MNKNFSQKCGLACEFIPIIKREDFRWQFISKASESELTDECREFLQLSCSNYDKYIVDLSKNRIPEELKKFMTKIVDGNYIEKKL